jgi:uncharacterized protein YgiM (DUF1202 family)
MSLAGISKYVLGFFLALAIIVATGAGALRYATGYMTSLPDRPKFPNDSSPPAAAKPKPDAPAAEPVAAPAATPAANVAIAATPSVPGLYEARVTQEVGLVLRDKPAADAAQVDGVAFDQTVTVLEESADGTWQRVRLGNGSEGWVRGNNTEKLP